MNSTNEKKQDTKVPNIHLRGVPSQQKGDQQQADSPATSKKKNQEKEEGERLRQQASARSSNTPRSPPTAESEDDTMEAEDNQNKTCLTISDSSTEQVEVQDNRHKRKKIQDEEALAEIRLAEYKQAADDCTKLMEEIRQKINGAIKAANDAGNVKKDVKQAMEGTKKLVDRLPALKIKKLLGAAAKALEESLDV